MVADWRNRSSGAGVSVLYKHGRKLVGDRTAKWRDVLKVDLQAIGVYDRWHEFFQDRKGWFHLCSDGVEKMSEKEQG